MRQKNYLSQKCNYFKYSIKKLIYRLWNKLLLKISAKRNKVITSELSINEKTVSTYKTRLLKKLKVDNLADLIHQARMFQFS